MRKLTAEDFAHLDIPSAVELYTSTRLEANRTQCVGACPYDDCMGDDDGFMVFYELSSRNCHFYCRNCKRAGDIVRLLQEILKKSFSQVCELLDIGKGKAPLNINVIRANRDRARREEAERQRVILAAIACTSQRGLQHERAQAYLAQRGVSMEIALQYGLCYIPPLKTMSSELKDAWWTMRQWTDRLIFPLSDGGYIGRSLHLWVPGMDEDEHKKRLDSFNERVKAHNEKVKAQGGKDYREKITRWYTTMTEGYFHGEVLATNEHVTVVEGPFDALALLAAGIMDVIAAGRNGINSDHIPLNVCYATIAFDADNKGQGGAAESEKTFRRKGIKTDLRTPPDDGLGKDWSARYRIAGIDGLTALFQPSQGEQHNPQARALRLQVEALIGPVDDSFLDMPVEMQQALLDDLLIPADCSTCLDLKVETPGQGNYEHDGLAYCVEHHPGRVAFAELAQQIATGAGRGIMEVLTASEMEQVKEQVNEERRAYWIRQAQEQQERDRARLVAAHAAKMNKYSQGSLMESA